MNPHSEIRNPKSAIHRSGFVAVVGKPNVGKSSLFNALIGKKRNIVKIAASDSGIGIRESLTERYGRSRPVWNDAAALALAFEERTSRFFDEGRGNGLKRVRDLVLQWRGRLAIRSGTSRLVIQADAPQQAVAADLPFFPGTQISIFLPELVQ